MTAQQISQLLHTWSGKGYGANPAFPMAGPQATAMAKPVIPMGGFGGFAQGAMAPQVQVNNPMAPVAPANDGGIGALLKAFTAPRGHHFGIGGAEISQDNPYGNPGGDPFKNGFFKSPPPMAPGMMFLGGTPNPTPQQLTMMKDAMLTRTTTPQIPIPAGDPQARAFWASMGR